MIQSFLLSRRGLAFLCCLFAAAPFLAVSYPPITDLPQHSAQIRLFLDTIANPEGSPYRIQWLTPYSLSYLIMGASWAVFGPMDAGRLAMLTIVLLWVIAIHGVASGRNRAAASACLASAFVLNHIVNWGFYSFGVGFPIFCLWLALTAEKQWLQFRPGRATVLLGVGLLLYTSHVLWLAVGLLWLALSGLLLHRDPKGTVVALSCLAPLFVAVWFWYPMFSESSMATPPLWATGPLDRLTLSELTDSALGGIKGPAELAVFGLIAAWIVVGLYQNRSNLRDTIDWSFLLAGLLFFSLAVFLPDKYMNTIRFGQRWMPPAWIMLVLAFPAPALRPILGHAMALTVVGAFCTAVAFAWLSFERTDMSGLKQSLEALPNSSRVMGLAFMRHSESVKGWPFIQAFAYAQVLKGGTLNFSFAEWSPCLVVHKVPFRRPWTGGLEWFPERVQLSDLDHFDFLLVFGPEEIHERWAKLSRLSPVTRTGRWRLYRVLQQQGGPQSRSPG